jgi:hypothetical protein
MNRFISRYFYPALWVVAVAIFLLHYVVTGQAVYGDGIGYYAHLHSWYFDQDWNYTNEYQHVYNPENNNRLDPVTSPTVQIVQTTAEGRAENHYSPGPALLLLPAYVVADVTAGIWQLVTPTNARNGYSDVYQIIVGISAVTYVIAGLIVLEKLLLRLVVDERVAKLVVVLMLMGTQLLYYGSFDVINSHFASFFLACLFFYVLLVRKVSLATTVLLGITAGIAASTRIQDGALFIIWLVDWTYQCSTDRRRQWVKYLQHGVIFALSFGLAFLPSIYHMYSVFDSPLQHRYLIGFLSERSQGQPISILGSLFHHQTGLFSVTPILAVSFLYFLWLLLQKKVTRELWMLALFFGIQFVIITVQRGWQAAAFGGRMYISSLPFFAVLLALLFIQLHQRRSLRHLLIFSILVVGINFWQMSKFILYDKGAEGGIVGTEERTRLRIETWKQKFAP